MSEGFLYWLKRHQEQRMVVQLRISQLEVLPGQRAIVHNVNWSEFEEILTELGDHRGTRLAYFAKTLELRMPEHEPAKVVMSDLIKILLEELNQEWESLRSTTFKKKEMLAGIEPDDCFYIANVQAVIGKNRIDLQTDPPPDLAIEIDLTSKTQISAYQTLGVKEIWRYQDSELAIFRLENGAYLTTSTSPTFPNLPIISMISDCLAQSAIQPMSAIRRDFRQRIRLLCPVVDQP